MKARARELAVCVPYVQPSVDSHARSDLCLSPPILSPQSSYQPPQPDAAIRLGPKFQVSTVPAYQGPSCTDACERGDQLLSLAEVELALARTTACRITAAAFHEPGVRLDLVGGFPQRRPGRVGQPSGIATPDRNRACHRTPCAVPARQRWRPCTVDRARARECAWHRRTTAASRISKRSALRHPLGVGARGLLAPLLHCWTVRPRAPRSRKCSLYSPW